MNPFHNRAGELVKLAEELYTQAGVPQGPAWGILSEASRQHWVEAARRKVEGVEDWWSCRHGTGR